MNPQFYDRAISTDETGDDGKPIYRLATYFKHFIDSNNTVEREAREDDKNAFPAEYALYDRSRQPDADGFPLSAWNGVNAAERQGLSDRGIFTVEKLAGTDMRSAPAELREAQEKAKAFLEKTSQEAPQLAARISELEIENETLKEIVADANAEIERLKAEAAKGGKK